MPLIGKGASRSSASAHDAGNTKGDPGGIAPPAMSLPFTGNGGNVTGMLPARTSCPSEDSDSRNVSTPIDVERIGSLRPDEVGWRSMKSKTPWPPGSMPVRNVGQAAHE